jgi:hypothetical protein
VDHNRTLAKVIRERDAEIARRALRKPSRISPRGGVSLDQGLDLRGRQGSTADRGRDMVRVRHFGARALVESARL